MKQSDRFLDILLGVLILGFAGFLLLSFAGNINPTKPETNTVVLY
ncbi:hypothetical protein [Enterococcus canis]|nr:hypothetical protein [Enterococcus canis]